MREPEWDIKTYPHLYPDGDNGMNTAGRKVKLSAQQYLVQRLFNKDPIFADHPAFLFSAVWYIESQQLERNVSLSYTHGRKKVGDNNKISFAVNDLFTVLSKISNTPEYWKQKKMELLAKLENKGPFQFFYTLSCADMRWDENFTSSIKNWE